MPTVQIDDYPVGFGYSMTRGPARENAVAALSVGRLAGETPQRLCRLTFGDLTDGETGLDATFDLVTSDPQTVAELLAHDWTDVDATRALCARLILPRLTFAQLQEFIRDIAREAWRQGCNDAQTTIRCALGLDVYDNATTPASIIQRVLGDRR
ncbi:MAG: hypothetical protein IPJ61_18900 [Tessaracoccus sp.]|uniref:hypothetical protein n=1 Tax=Tessaracoccus sp. TaxID=1971211 RepID=UPI001EB34462|nr:hypothetical protein [Tessaracoccus sp.]MBK7823055.1 hypothetical protein [Tessaracoccus sp.]